MTAIVSDLLKSGLLVQEEGVWRLTAHLTEIVPAVPETLQQMLEIQVERLSEADQRVLKAASIAGRRFSAWAVAAMLGRYLRKSRPAPAVLAAWPRGWSTWRGPIGALRISAFAVSRGVISPYTGRAARTLASASCRAGRGIAAGFDWNGCSR